MTTRLFKTVEGKITPITPGVPQPVIVQHVRDSAIEACERTLAWRYEQDAITLTPGVYQYDYEVPDQSEVVGVFHSAISGSALAPVSLEQLLGQYPDWPNTATDARGNPSLVAQYDPDHFVLAPVPDTPTTPYQIKMILALRPTMDATGMDQTAFDELEPLIVDGALKRLLSIPNQSWTNGDLADYYARQVVFKTASRRAKANHGTVRASLSVQFPPFA